MAATVKQSSKINTQSVEYTEAEDKSRFIFWHILTKSDNNGGSSFADVKIDHLIMTDLLYNNNYRRFDIDEQSIFIKITNDRIIKRVEVKDMQDFIFDYIDNLPKEINSKWGGIDVIKRIRGKVLNGVTSFFNTQKLYILKPKTPIKFNKDTLTEKFIYFENGVLKITKTKIDFVDYSKITGYVWENEIIKKEFIQPKADPAKDHVRKFFYLVAGQKPNRFNDLCICAGYYAHDFYDYKLQALILTDSTISQGQEANGRTGKTLFCRLVGGMLSNDIQDASIKTYVEINAKDFDPKKDFKYSACGLDTKLIVLNDLRRGFDVDSVYNDVTEGIDVNRKGLHPFKIRSKMILTTNKTVKLSGDSDTDRFLEFEFSNYFSKKHSPENEFKHWFFRDWNNEDYCRYYLFMAECVQQYFQNNCKLNEPEQINLNKRKLIEQTSEDFIEWIETLKPEVNKDFNKTELYNSFINDYPDWNNQHFKQKRFSLWLQNYCNFNPDLDNYIKDKNEKRDSANRWFIFLKTNEK